MTDVLAAISPEAPRASVASVAPIAPIKGAGRIVLLLGALAAVAAGVAFAADASFVARVLKPIPVIALAIFTATLAPTRSSRLVAFGLFLSALGDALLDVPGAFIGGMAAFGAAHISYIAACVSEDRVIRPSLALPFAAWCVGLFLYVRPGLGALTIPVAVYAVVISAMMWRAAARYVASPSRRALIGVVGAGLFGLSDSLIAIKLGAFEFSGMRAVILTTYWLGQAGIALSFRGGAES